jgi:hypothetical protein
MNHKRRRPKNRRAGCLLYKPHKHPQNARRRMQDGGNSDDLVLSREELADYVDREAHATLGVGREEAFAMLDRGELDGSIMQAELSMMRAMLERNPSPGLSPASPKVSR